MSTSQTITTPLTKVLNVRYPIFLAGMNKASGAKLAAAVTNAGGIGVIGGLGFSPRILRLTINNLRKHLIDKNATFGVDFPIPKIGGNARATNYDYQKGHLLELIDILIEMKVKLFVSAIGCPSKEIVDKLHEHNIFVMSMIGHPKHIHKVCKVGVDIVCAQGTEGGGHTGNIATSILLPVTVNIIRKYNYRSPLTHEHVYVVGAGGIYNGYGLALSLVCGAQAVWVGTRFVCSTESNASELHKKAIINAGYDDTYTSEVYSGRPLRMIKNDYIGNWKRNRVQEMKQLLADGKIPINTDMDTKKMVILKPENVKPFGDFRLYLSGQCAGPICSILSAKEIVDNMMKEAIETIQNNYNQISVLSKL